MRLPHLRIDSVVLSLVCLGLATTALVGLGYRATREWQRTARLSSEQRASEVLTLLATALDRDMKGAQVSVLVPLNQQTLVLDPPYDLAERFARAFARFPYPESFFAWRGGDDRAPRAYFFNRSDRPPRWDAADRSADPYPVTTLRDPVAPHALVVEALRRAEAGARFGLFEITIDERSYQVVVHYIHRGDGTEQSRSQLFGLVGFTVDLDWVRHEYFGQLIQQVRRVVGSDDSLELRIMDETDASVVSTPSPEAADDSGSLRVRTFPLVFFDRTLLSSVEAPTEVREWKAAVNAFPDSTVRAAVGSATRSFALMSLAAVATTVALLLTLRAARDASRLAAMKSEFVSSVTHELKTPLALIQLVSETLEQRRFNTPEVIVDYSRLLAREAKSLTRLIDNLLMVARVSDTPDPYTFESVDVADLLEETLDRFHASLVEQCFDVSLDVPQGLPAVRIDRGAMRQVVENLIDNAMKYSKDRREIAITAGVAAGRVRIDVADRGNGIAPDELPHVFDKFYRGRSAGREGSGLGLAIAKRIVAEHGGTIGINSGVGQGTTVTLELPMTSRV